MPLLSEIFSCSWGYTAVLSLALTYSIVILTYRLLLSPLSGFPGPKIAAVTGWYECYYDVLKQGQYLYKIEKMHDIYGKSIQRRN